MTDYKHQREDQVTQYRTIYQPSHEITTESTYNTHPSWDRMGGGGCGIGGSGVEMERGACQEQTHARHLKYSKGEI